MEFLGKNGAIQHPKPSEQRMKTPMQSRDIDTKAAISNAMWPVSVNHPA
jgi:hypothetical protein